MGIRSVLPPEPFIFATSTLPEFSSSSSSLIEIVGLEVGFSNVVNGSVFIVTIVLCPRFGGETFRASSAVTVTIECDGDNASVGEVHGVKQLTMLLPSSFSAESNVVDLSMVRRLQFVESEQQQTLKFL